MVLCYEQSDTDTQTKFESKNVVSPVHDVMNLFYFLHSYLHYQEADKKKRADTKIQWSVVRDMSLWKQQVKPWRDQ